MQELFDLFYATSGVCTDTRKIENDSLFICLKGANFNGNTFAQQALKEGARYVICDEAEYATDENIFLVPNALKFLQNLATYHRRQFSLPVIGITGSNGKTSTKELINAVLSEKYTVLATIGNLNNHIGVPLTLLRLTNQHEIAIIEMGANQFKDIEELCAIAEPTHGIITNIGKAHLEGFGGFEGVLKTKKELYEAIESIGGTLVVNSDDQVLLQQIKQETKVLTYGTLPSADIVGELVKLDPFVNLKWTDKSYTSPELQTHMVGKYNFYNFLAAIAFGRLFHVDPLHIDRAISNYTPQNNRSQIVKSKRNTLILDCYNANPTSMRSALESFSMIEHPNKLFIIGDMLELGEQANTEHAAILDYIEENKLTGFTVGPLFQSLKKASALRQFSTREEASAYFTLNQIDNALILLKGSRGIGLETLEAVL
jgi:UDP-N-acetylmuramoyl-tripeptide--D-alanyl-D-alanine ligase